MPKFFINSSQINQNKIIIKGDDVKHIKNVLRLNSEDKIQICNIDTSTNYNCKIEGFDKENIECLIIDEIKSKCESNIHINIFQGLPKAEKMELIIQKCVELGIYEISPVEMKRCVVKLDEKNKIKKLERWQKISETAAKQCGRDIIPKINNIINVKNICNLIENYDIVLLLYENETSNYLKDELIKLKDKKEILNIAIIIGPEGGIEQEEVEMLKKSGAKVVTLGNRILRTETVPIAVTSIIMYELGDLGGNNK